MQKQALVVYNWLGVIDYISSRLTQESKEYMTTAELIEQRTQPMRSRMGLIGQRYLGMRSRTSEEIPSVLQS
jgi:hypothetical protein